MGISEVIAEYDRTRAQNSKKEELRLREVYKKIPEMKDLHLQIKSLQLIRIKQALTGDSDNSKKIHDLIEKATKLLTENGFNAHYLDPIYRCPVCRDTGMRDNAMRCECFKKRVLEDKLDEARLTDNSISFEQFDINVFDDTPIDNGRSQKEIMQKIKILCEAYADAFPGSKPILLLSGATGLGKTFLSKCIMRRVIERGYTAAYYTAYRLFSLFHQDRLGENVDLNPIFEVPLLIIDDIGTEPMTRNVTKEYLFDLLNERNCADLNTLIITNLPFHKLKDRYGDRIHSRLMDKKSSQKILFKGNDIRY
ncbi:MAG: ATP-binding protein [Christensenellales bacterium]